MLREALRRRVVAVPESPAHRLESARRPDLRLLELLRDLSGGLRLTDLRGRPERRCERVLREMLERDFPQRHARPSDATDLRALSLALPNCQLVTCDAFMAELIARARLDVRFGCELFSGRRRDVDRLRRRLEELLN